MNERSQYSPGDNPPTSIARVLLLGTLLSAAPAHCIADLVDTVNRLRVQSCREASVVAQPLIARAALDETAQRLADGKGLATPISRTGYRAKTVTSIHVRATPPEHVAHVLTRRFCDTIADPHLHEIGVFQRGHEVWIVLAEPFPSPDPGDAREIANRVIDLINEVRLQPRRCGRKTFPAAPALKPSAALRRAALAHARDMASVGHLDHRGSDGSLPAERVTRAGYSWAAVAENVAAGPSTAEDVVNGWLASPGHCANLMNSRYSGTGVALVFERVSEKGTYWVQVFAAPM